MNKGLIKLAFRLGYQHGMEKRADPPHRGLNDDNPLVRDIYKNYGLLAPHPSSDLSSDDIQYGDIPEYRWFKENKDSIKSSLPPDKSGFLHVDGPYGNKIEVTRYPDEDVRYSRRLGKIWGTPYSRDTLWARQLFDSFYNSPSLVRKTSAIRTPALFSPSNKDRYSDDALAQLDLVSRMGVQPPATQPSYYSPISGYIYSRSSDPRSLRHEIGHAKDHAAGLFSDFYGTNVLNLDPKTVYEVERHAWDTSGVPEDDPRRQMLLSTYDRDNPQRRSDAIDDTVDLISDEAYNSRRPRHDIENLVDQSPVPVIHDYKSMIGASEPIRKALLDDFRHKVGISTREPLHQIYSGPVTERNLEARDGEYYESDPVRYYNPSKSDKIQRIKVQR